MRKYAFLRIIGDLSRSDNYFTQRVDATNKEGGTTALECLRRLCKGIIRLYEQEYLRAPIKDDLQKNLHASEMRGFLGMIGCIDCMHWEWKKFPTAWEDHSPVFDDVEQGNTPRVKFFVNQRPYDMAYYLADEGYQKDIERAFGVLQARFKIIREPARMWEISDLAIIMRSCIILHNMIVENERDTYAQNWTDYDQSEASGSSTPQPFSTEVLPAFANHEVMLGVCQMLVESLWFMFFASTELTILEDGTDEGVCVLITQELNFTFLYL
uniref:DDE Tnp4 domain-containing protein n=1 Tax=Brassica oleracea var. oleracea TaxID=109376 RepID=A0A0D3BLG2_BRAOL